MVESAQPHRLVSVEENLEFEKDSPIEHEYVGGMVYAWTGATYRHNRVAGKIHRGLADAAEEISCRVYMSDMRLLAPADVFYYPGVMVAQPPPETDNPVFRRSPCLVVEVTSLSTVRTDRREKLPA